VTKDGKLGNAAVLGLNCAKTFESFFVSTIKKTKRIPEAKRSYNYQEGEYKNTRKVL